MARKIINEPFTLLESDLVFDISLLDNMIFPDRIAVAGIQPWMNGTTVSIDSSLRVNEFKDNTLPHLNETRYKTVNIYSFSQSSWCAIVEKLNRYISTGNVSCYYEAVLAEMVEEGSLSLEAVSFDNKPWYEIDTIEDLIEAVKLFPADFYDTSISGNVILEAS
jgi:choline kinase